MENCGVASATIADRVRDPLFTATTQLNIIGLMSYAQQVTNAVLSDIVQAGILTLQPRTLIYQLSAYLPAAIKVLAVQDASGRDLDPVSLVELQHINMRWPTALSDSPIAFTQVGADLLIIYPGLSLQQNITVKYSEYLPAVALTTDSTVVPNEDDTCVNALTETLLLLKNRDLNAVAAALKRFTSRVEELREARR